MSFFSELFSSQIKKRKWNVSLYTFFANFALLNII